MCQGDVCVPVRDAAALVEDEHVDLSRLGEAVGVVIALDADEGIAVFGGPCDAARPTRRRDRGRRESWRLPDLDGARGEAQRLRGAEADGGRLVVVVRLPLRAGRWQALQDELGERELSRSCR